MQLSEASNMSYGNVLLKTMPRPNKPSIHYRAGLYLRLSRDDNNSNSESMSIQSQKEMLIVYANEHGYEITEIYADDGWTGTTYDRPGFKRMIEDIKRGRINMVLTKDLSRLGRNYVMNGHYRDYFFPDYGIRYIAVNDNYDGNEEDNDIAPFKDILNEMYAKDISKKVRSSRKTAANQGKFMGSIPAYGYIRSDADKHKLVIDEAAGKIVRRIFALFVNHESARYIADVLNKEGTPTPQNYYYNSVGQENPYKKNAKTWCSATVLSILRNEVYLGRMVQSKRAVKSFKTKKVEALPPEMWVVVENTHEALVSQRDFDAAQIILKARAGKLNCPKKTASGELSLFTNIVRCMDCGSNLTYGSTPRKTFIDHYYRCSRNLQHGKEACTSHRITLELLSAAVLEDIRKNARLAREDEEAFVKKLHRISMREKLIESERKRKRESVIRNRLMEIDTLIQKTFEKNVNGLLPDTMLKSLLDSYGDEKSKLESELSDLQAEILRMENQTADISKEIGNLKKYAEINTLDRKIVTNLIQSIHISEPRTVDREKVYDIEIRYKFQNPHIRVLESKKENTPFADEVSSESCELSTLMAN